MDKFNNAPVGVFDSGVGGLTVAREITRQLPNESIVYFGDTARVPYGSKSKDTIIKYARQIVRFLKTNDVKAIVVEQLGVSPEDVKENSSFIEDLNADSLDLTELIMTLEEKFAFEISENEAEQLRTVGDVIKYIQERQN